MSTRHLGYDVTKWQAAAIVLLAFILMTNGMGDLRMWGDTSYSVTVARQDLVNITLGRTSDSHPPLFYYLLHLWIAIAGQSEYAARFLSIAPATLTVALVFRCGLSLLHDRRVALVAIALTALSAPLVYQSRLIRMYGPFTFLALLSLYLLLAALRYGRRDLWLGYFAASLLAVYTHYFALLFLLAGGGFFVIRFPTHRPHLRPYVIANLALIVVYIPWLVFAAYSASQATASIISQAPSPPGLRGYLAQTVLVAMNVGSVVDLAEATPIAAAMLVAIVAMAVVRFWPKPRPDRALQERTEGDESTALAIILLIVIAVGAIVFHFVPYAVRPRFLLPSVPIYLLLIAWLFVGAFDRHRATAIVAAALFAVGMLYALHVTYPVEGRLFEPEAVALTEQLEGIARSDDALILHAFWQSGYFSSHFKGPSPVLLDMAEVPPERADVALKDYRRVWLARYPFADGTPASLSTWLDQHFVRIEDRPLGALRLSLYTRQISPATQNRRDLVFSAADGRPLVHATAAIGANTVRGGDAINVAIRWQALGKLDRYTVMLHLVDVAGQRQAGQDGEPFDPTTEWEVGQVVVDQRALIVPITLPPGLYQLRIGLYQSNDPQARPLLVRDGDGIVGTLTVAGPSAMPVGVGGFHLREGAAIVGVELDHDRLDPAMIRSRTIQTADGPLTLTERPQYHPGDNLALTLYWRLLAQPSAGCEAFVQLLSADGKEASLPVAIAQAKFGSSARQPGLVMPDRETLGLPSDLRQGQYQIAVGWQATGTDSTSERRCAAGHPVAIRQVEVVDE